MSGGDRVFRGTFKGTGALLSVTTVGFRPRKVRLQNTTTNIMLEWDDTLGDGAGYKTVAAGTRTNITSNGITPLATGFSIGTDSVNVSTNEIHFEASN